MKCWRCGAENPDNTKECLQCHILQNRTAPGSDAGKAMRALYDQYGSTEILNNPVLLTNGLGDLLPDAKKLRGQIKLGLDVGLGGLYADQLRTAGKPDADFDARVRKILTEDAGLSDKLAGEMAGLFDEMIGWRSSPAPQKQLGSLPLPPEKKTAQAGKPSEPGPQASQHNTVQPPRPASGDKTEVSPAVPKAKKKTAGILVGAILTVVVLFYLLNLQNHWVRFPWESKAHVDKEYYDSGEVQRETAYDDQGRQVSIKTYTKDGKVNFFREDQEYDQNGNPIHFTCHYYDEIGKFAVRTYDAVYNSRNQKTEDTSYLADRTLLKYYTYEYDAKGNMICEKDYDRKGGVCEEIRTYTYDSSGKKTGYRYESPVSLYASYTEYDTNGREISSTGYYPDGSVWFTYTYQYDSKGNKTSLSNDGYKGIETHNADGTIESINYRPDGTPSWRDLYDSEWNLLKQMDYSYNDGSLLSYSVFEYDENMCRTKRTTYKADGTLDSYTLYFCDEHGQEIRSEDYDSAGNLTSYGICKYSPRGNNILSDSYYPSGVLQRHSTRNDHNVDTEYTVYNENGSISYEYVYDQYGKELKNIWYDSNGIISTVYNYQYGTTKYGKVEYYKDGSLEYYKTYDYDAHGSITKTYKYDPAGTLLEAKDGWH